MIKRIILALILGASAVFAFAPYGYWMIIFISYSGLLLLLQQQNFKSTALIGFSWGCGFFAAGINWVSISIQQYGQVSPIIAFIILMLLVAYLALYPMIFALLLQRINCRNTFIKLVIAAPAIWQITEYLRGYILTGFAWLQIGYTQTDSLLSAYLPYFGINGLNLLLPILCGLVVYLIQRSRQQYSKKQCALISGIFLLFAIIIPWGLKQFQWTVTDPLRRVNVALIQGNIEQSLKWNRDTLQKTLNLYQELTEQQLEKADIIIWPEAAVTDLETNQQTYLKQLDQQAQHADSSILLGIINLQLQNFSYKIYNTLVVLGDEQAYDYATANRYNKHHLVPFGEFTPLEWLLEPIAKLLNIPMSSMSAGDYIQAPLVVKGYKFTTAICYEIILPQLLWDNFTPETDFLLTISNDAWFGDSIGPWQHFQMARTRAMEFGRPLIRGTNNGITAVIDQHGTVVKQLPQFEQNVLTVELSPSIGLTPYANWGNTPYWILTFFMLVIAILGQKKRS